MADNSKWSEIRSWLAFIISLIALALTYLQSPLSPLLNPKLRFFQEQFTSPDDGIPQNGIGIFNDSPYVPARNVVVEIWSEDTEIKFFVKAQHKVTKSDDYYMIEIPTIPPGGMVDMSATVSKRKPAPKVTKVYNDYGQAKEFVQYPGHPNTE